MPQLDVGLHRRAPQVNVAVLQPHFFVGQRRLRGQKRRRLRLVQQQQFFRHHLDLAGRDVAVHGCGVALLDLADDRDHELGAQRGRLVVQARAALAVEHHLRDPGAVADVNENQVAEVAPAVHPSHEHGARSGIAGAQRAAGVSPSKISQEVEHEFVVAHAPSRVRPYRQQALRRSLANQQFYTREVVVVSGQC